MSFPESIAMSGLPIYWSGWNNKFHKTSQLSDDCPVYQLAGYNMVGVIPIIGATIYRKDGIWRFRRECDEDEPEFLGIRKYGTSSQTDPFGHWTHNGYVTPA